MNKAHSNPSIGSRWIFTSISVNFYNQTTTIRAINDFDVDILSFFNIGLLLLLISQLKDGFKNGLYL